MLFLYIALITFGLLLTIQLIHFLIFLTNYQPALMYHRINDSLKDSEARYINHKGNKLDTDQMKTTLSNFDKQMMFLKRAGFKTVTDPQKGFKNIMITFDDGYKDNMNATKILNKYNFKGIFYLTTNYIMTNNIMELDKKDLVNDNTFLSKKDIEEIITKGHKIGAHTKNHSWLNDSLSLEKLQDEIVGSKLFLEENFNIKVNTFAYPAGIYNDNSLKIVKENFSFAVATARGSDLSLFNKDLYQIERESIERTDSMFKFKVKVYGIHRYLRKHFLVRIIKKILKR